MSRIASLYFREGEPFPEYEPARESDVRSASPGSWNDIRNHVRVLPPANEHASFRLRINECAGVLRNPGGNFQHWAVLFGTLEAGTLRRDDRILFPDVNGRVWSGRVQNLVVDRRRSSIAEPAHGEIEVFIATPAPPTDMLEGTCAIDCDSETHDRASAAMVITCAPGEYGYLHCRACVAGLRDGSGPFFAAAARARIATDDEFVTSVLLNAVEFTSSDGELLMGLAQDLRESVRHLAAHILYEERFESVPRLLDVLGASEDPTVRKVAKAIQQRQARALERT